MNKISERKGIPFTFLVISFIILGRGRLLTARQNVIRDWRYKALDEESRTRLSNCYGPGNLARPINAR